MPGNPPQLIVTTGALHRLTDHQLDAVLTHERGHARARHNWLLHLSHRAGHRLPPGPAVLPDFPATRRTAWSNSPPTTPPPAAAATSTTALALIELNQHRGVLSCASTHRLLGERVDRLLEPQPRLGPQAPATDDSGGGPGAPAPPSDHLRPGAYGTVVDRFPLVVDRFPQHGRLPHAARSTSSQHRRSFFSRSTVDLLPAAPSTSSRSTVDLFPQRRPRPASRPPGWQILPPASRTPRSAPHGPWWRNTPATRRIRSVWSTACQPNVPVSTPGDSVAAARRRRLRADHARQLADLLRHQVLTGGFPDGVLPHEEVIGADYRVSRNTVRQALDLLRAEQLVARQPGVGTVVVGQKYPHALDRLMGLAETLHSTRPGHQRGTHHRPGRRTGPGGGPAADPAARRGALRGTAAQADGLPLSLDLTYIPMDIGLPLLDADLENNDVFRLIEETAGSRWAPPRSPWRPSTPTRTPPPYWRRRAARPC